MRVATFNIRHCRGRDGVVDPARTADVINAIEPDLLAVQELDRNITRSEGADQPLLLSELTGLSFSFHPTLRFDDGEYGIALAAREPLELQATELPRLGDEEPRAALVARWSGLSVVATHLSRAPAARDAQTVALAELAVTLAPPVVVLGDFNQRVRGLGALASAGLRPARPGALSRWRPASPIDHILLGAGVTARRACVVRTRASDHYPVVAELARG